MLKIVSALVQGCSRPLASVLRRLDSDRPGIDDADRRRDTSAV